MNGAFAFLEMKKLIFPILVLLPFFVSAQKRSTKSFAASGIETINIKADEIFRIYVATADIDHIKVKTVSEGEYYRDINLHAEVKEDEIILESRLNDIYKSDSDKLNVHKVFSLEMELLVPKNMNIFIQSNIASVEMKGKYKNVQAELKSGHFKADKFYGNANVKTYSGNIFLKIENSAQVEASSRKGSVEISENSEAGNYLKLHSLSGDIKVSGTK